MAASVGHRTLFDFETGKRNPHPRTLAAIRSALEGAGAEFIERESGEVGVSSPTGGRMSFESLPLL